MVGKIPKKKERPGVDRLGRTELHYAVVDNLTEEVSRLIDAGADVNARDDNHWTPLHFAAQSCAVEIAKMLLEHGAEVDPENAHGDTPLMLAVMNYTGNGDLIVLLRKSGANPNRSGRENEITPLYAARNFVSDITKNCPASHFFTDLP